MSDKPPVILKKGNSPLVLRKTPLIVARASWDPSKDYDLFALILKRDGKSETVATFGAGGFLGFIGGSTKPQLSALNGAIKHSGDIRSGGKSDETQETIEIRMTPEIIAVVPVAYSAMSNGVGSFRDYRVSLEIDNGAGERVVISSGDISGHENIYTCALGIIENTETGVRIHALELYSAPNSENRPIVELRNGEVVVVMDRGPRNNFKL